MCPKVKLPASRQENWKPFETCWNASVQEACHDVSFYKNFEFAMLINLVGKNPLGLNVMAYRIYSNKHRPRLSVAYVWSGKVNTQHPQISAAAPVRRLFEYFHKMIQIHCNRCNAVLSQQWEFIFINSDVFQFKPAEKYWRGCYESQNSG